MKVSFFDEAWEDYLLWQKTDKAILKRINELIRDIQRDTFDGIGKPEPLKHNLQGWWARRVTQEHRLVYGVLDDDLQILSVRYHYEN